MSQIRDRITKQSLPEVTLIQIENQKKLNPLKTYILFYYYIKIEIERDWHQKQSSLMYGMGTQIIK